MVRITEANFDKEYERIKQDSVEGNCIIFVASDVDAICACKIFQVRTSMHLVPPRDPLAHCIYYSLCWRATLYNINLFLSLVFKISRKPTTS